MSTVAIKLRPLEPLHLGVRNLGGIEGFSIDEVVHTPLPSTVLGVIGSILGIKIDCRCGSEKYDLCDPRELISQLTGIELNLDTRTSEPVLWGPLIETGNGRYIPIGNRFLREEHAGEYVKAATRYYRGEDVKDLGRLLISYADAWSKVGIELNEEAKTVNRMFKARYVSYRHNLNLTYLLRAGKKLNNGVVRLGGEGRLAMLSVTDEKINTSRKGNYAIALQPILIHSDKTTADIGEVVGLECVEEIYGAFDGEKFKVRVVDVGLGFSEACKFRRPMLKAMPQGTVVKLREDCGDVVAIGLLSTLGYGSIYKVDHKSNSIP
jgi:CRISPR-associated protein Cmr3